MRQISDTISISVSSMTEAGNGFKIIGTAPQKHTEKKGIEQSYEQMLIDNFKEQNSPENNKIQQICGKFRAGQELTGDELQYLASHSPELYREVCEIIQERRAMELRMKQAKTKQQVTLVCLNEFANVKERIGTGEQAKSQALKTMARTNQIRHAYVKYTSSIEYKNKEDAKTQAEDMCAKLAKLEDILEEQQDNVAEVVENITVDDTQFQFAHTEEITNTVEQVYDEVCDRAEDVTENIKEMERKRKKQKSRQKGNSGKAPEQLQHIRQAKVDYESLWKKTKELYQKDASKSSVKSKHLNVSL